MKHLRDEKEALNELESKQKLQASLEKRNASIEVTLIPNIKREIDGLQSVKSQHENRIEELKNEEEKLKKEKLEKIRAKRTQDIYKDVGGSDRTIRHNGSDFCPHEKCVDFPNRDYTCHYLGAVREAVDFVSDALEIEKNIDIEARQLELLKKLSEERYEHSVGAKKDGKHVEQLKEVVDRIVSRRKELEQEAASIGERYQERIDKILEDISEVEKWKIDIDKDIEISNGTLQKLRQELVSNQLTIINTKEAIKLIGSTMKQKQDLIHLLEEKKCLADAKVRFSEDVPNQDKGSIFLRNECLKQLKILEDYRSYLNDENQKYTTETSIENHQQQLEHLKNDLYNLEQKKKEIEYHIQQENIVNKVEVIKLQLSYFESLHDIKDIHARSILLNQSFQINSRTHYGFDFRGEKYAYQLPDPNDNNNNDIQIEHIQRINRISKLVKLIDKQIVELKAERQSLSDLLKTIVNEQRLIHFQNVERYLLNRSIHLSGFDRFYDGSILNPAESLISVLISEIIDRPHLYQMEGNNCLDPLVEQGLMKI
ncbi:unnamed protein product [Rotaria magnacalcarata]|nr:unnamed protein product [Rotaria magnacalcarata]